MSPKEYIEKYVKIVNHHVVVEAIPENSPYCETCWTTKSELNPAPFNQSQGAWVCSKGHVGKIDKLASGGVTYGPR